MSRLKEFRFGIALLGAFLCVSTPVFGQDRGGPDSHLALLATEFVAPDDPRLTYSEYVHLTVTPSRAIFDRSIVSWFTMDHSPGARIHFATDANRIRLKVDYQSSNPSFSGAGQFGLEVDGVLQPFTLGSDTELGVRWYTVQDFESNERREFALILPIARDVDFLGLELFGRKATLRSPPPPRPAFLYVAHGDSITQGYYGTATAESYAHRVGDLKDWSVINMGFAGRKIAGADGVALASLNADWISIAIGINDYLGNTTAPTTEATFLSRYNALLNQLRERQPLVRVFAITPTWTAMEGVPNSEGLVPETYRQLIRIVVAGRFDENLHVVEGLSLVPAGLQNFPDGLHPNDAGFALYASALSTVFSGYPGGQRQFVSDGRGWFTSAGRRGSIGVPLLSTVDRRAPYGTVWVDLDNSLGRPTLGAVFASRSPSAAWEFLSMLPSTASNELIVIPRGGVRTLVELPLSAIGAGPLRLQALQLDPGAIGGVSVSRVITLGSETR